MAYKRLFLCTLLLAICYLVGVTWADTGSALPINGSIVAGNLNTSGVGGAAAISNNSNTIGVATNNKTPGGSTILVSSTLAPVILPNIVPTASNKTTPKCVCDGALLPRLGENGKAIEICPECKCQHEARNTTLIKVVVIIVIWIISILVIYMLFLMCLDPLLNKRVKANYQEHTNEDDDATSSSPPLPGAGLHQELNARANVLNRVGHQQDKWKRQVREQRRHIYDRRTMLN